MSIKSKLALWLLKNDSRMDVLGPVLNDPSSYDQCKVVIAVHSALRRAEARMRAEHERDAVAEILAQQTKLH